MILVNLQNIHKNYDAKKILNGVDFFIQENERVAIVGKNGSGKSTLLKIVYGILDADEGLRSESNQINIQMLSQNPVFQTGLNVEKAIENELKELTLAKEKYNNLLIELANAPENKNLIEEVSKLSTYLDFHRAWNLDDKIKRILQAFDLESLKNREISSLSGGEQRRVALAGLILKKPDLLLLDEPTNHLDVYMVKFLEELLISENFTLLFISHDRYFIDKIATKVIEIEDASLRSFKGGYSSYLVQKQELLKNMQKEHETLLKHLKTEEEWLQKGVRARIKRNEGRKARVLKMREEAKKNPSVIRKVQIELEREQKAFNRTGESKSKRKMLFDLKNISYYIQKNAIIKNFSNTILQKDKIAIVGKNGAGKSTLLKLLMGDLELTFGEIKKGEFEIGYFDQHREMLNDDKNLIETFCPQGGDRVDVKGKNMHVYGYLKNWLFPREYLDKKIGMLSGGEKNRVALALIFTKKYDCLILDEPTNDLDIPTINILEEYLQSFNGALLFVSHDRFFIDKIAQKLLIFKGNAVIEESYQNYSEYLEIEENIKEIDSFQKSFKEPKKEQHKPKKTKKLGYKENLEYEKLPDEIEELELEVKNLEECLSNFDCYSQEGLTKLSQKLQNLKDLLDNKINRFLELEEKLS